MPEPLIHFALPFALLTARGMDPKKAALISLIAVLPDLDVLIHIHRSYTHSLLIPMAVLIIALLKYRNRWLILAALSYASHPILDFVTYYTPILWPIYPGSLWLKATLDIHIASLPTTIKLNIELLEQPASEALRPFKELEATAVTGQGFLIALALMLTPFIVRRRLKAITQQQPQV